MQLKTQNSLNFSTGLNISDASLQSVVWDLVPGVNGEHMTAFVGFEGTQGTSSIKSLRPILVDLFCTAGESISSSDGSGGVSSNSTDDNQTADTFVE